MFRAVRGALIGVSACWRAVVFYCFDIAFDLIDYEYRWYVRMKPRARRHHVTSDTVNPIGIENCRIRRSVRCPSFFRISPVHHDAVDAFATSARRTCNGSYVESRFFSFPDSASYIFFIFFVSSSINHRWKPHTYRYFYEYSTDTTQQISDLIVFLRIHTINLSPAVPFLLISLTKTSLFLQKRIWRAETNNTISMKP